ncbi:MAG: flagellar type III secretion system pore protein FliP [Chthonomonadales bacterium]|nr:flagellar type III secretion system pore protein FliP [Chthonomonadales bacterium]
MRRGANGTAAPPERSFERLLPCTARLVRAATGPRPLCAAAAVALLAGAAAIVSAQSLPAIPRVSIGVERARNPADVAVTLQVLIMLTVLTLAPSILIMTTAFTRIVIVLSILRSAIGLPQVPPNQVLVGLALFMTFFVMRPVLEQINDTALQPYLTSKIAFTTAVDRGVKPLRGFMVRQTYTKDMAFFVNLARLEKAPATPDDVPLSVIVPAFITSELKTAFTMGFYIYLPFLVIDIVVASTLMSMGMMMLPPTMIALPAKILLFVLANGWTLLLGSLAKGFR